MIFISDIVCSKSKFIYITKRNQMKKIKTKIEKLLLLKNRRAITQQLQQLQARFSSAFWQASAKNRIDEK